MRASPLRRPGCAPRACQDRVVAVAGAAWRGAPAPHYRNSWWSSAAWLPAAVRGRRWLTGIRRHLLWRVGLEVELVYVVRVEHGRFAKQDCAVLTDGVRAESASGEGLSGLTGDL